MFKLWMIDYSANLGFVRSDALRSHAPEPAADHLLPVHAAAELSQQEDRADFRDVPALSQHEHADNGLVWLL